MIGTRERLTPSTPEARYFLAPDKILHRQYEALRAYFVDGLPSVEVAERFAYSPGGFRVLCHQFRHDPAKRGRFFSEVKLGPQSAPLRDKLREEVVALRKRNLSVYDIRAELREAGHEVSIHSLCVILREEGFARLPRRGDDERRSRTGPEPAAVADVRVLDPSPRRFHTKFGGLFFFVPLLERFDLASLVAEAGLPGSKMIPAENAIRSALALKLVGTERGSHVMSDVFDEGLAIFAGLNAIPKRSWFANLSSRVDRVRIDKLMALWFDQVTRAGVRRSGSIDLDFHSVPANTEKEPLGKHYISGRSRSQKSVLVFLARDAEERLFLYSNAALAKPERDNEIVRFCEFYKERTGVYPEELVFDSQLTTYEKLDWLNRHDIRFITLRRRTRKMLARLYSLPLSRWKRVTLKSLTRTYRTPRVLDEKITLKGYEGELRQLSITELGHEDPTILLTNGMKEGLEPLITRYAHRMLIENGIAEGIHFFHFDALSSMVELKVDFDFQITLMGSALYRMLAKRLPENYRRAHAKTVYDNVLDVGGNVEITDREVVVTLDHHAHNPVLAETGFLERPTPMPWYFGRNLILRLK